MSATEKSSSGVRLAIDYVPLLVFAAITFFAPDFWVRSLVASASSVLDPKYQLESVVVARVIVATVGFMIATVVAMILSRIKLGTISPMLWISGGLVLVFGALTIVFQDIKFIQMKPTFVYAIFAATLFVGLLTGRPLLQQLLGAAYPGLSELGWRKVTLNWAVFFVVLALANEVARQVLTVGAWTLFKFPGCVILTFLFAAANVPMMLKHGLMADAGGATVDELPPE